MIYTLLSVSLMTASTMTLTHHHDATGEHDNKAAMEHDHQGHDHGHNHDAHADADTDKVSVSSVYLSRNDDIEAALANGGSPVVVEVLGVVCDFCAKAMNKTFGKQAAVSAVYVDLDTKTLNLVLTDAAAMADDEIDAMVVKSGYKTKAIYRGASVLGGPDATDPS